MATKKKAAPLNGLFHYKEAGGTFGGEIVAGVSMGILAVCGMFMNMQMVLQVHDRRLLQLQQRPDCV